MDTLLQVVCYSGHRADERPVRFTLAGRTFAVVSVEDKWYSPGDTFVRVLADDGNRYLLRHREAQDVWLLEGFRSSQTPGTPVPGAGEPPFPNTPN